MTPDHKKLMQYAFLSGAVAARQAPPHEGFMGPRAFKEFLISNAAKVEDPDIRRILDAEAPTPDDARMFFASANCLDEENIYERMIKATSPEFAAEIFEDWLVDEAGASGAFEITVREIPDPASAGHGVQEWSEPLVREIDFSEESVPEVA